MIVGILVVALIGAAIAGGFYWMGSREGGVSGAPELIKAPATPYKIKPQDPGGLDIAGESQTTFETSAGQDVDSRLNLGKTGDEDVTTTPQPTQAAPAGETKTPAETPAPAAPAAEPRPSGASGSVIQLGAYKNVAQAERAWAALAARFGALSGMSKMVVPYSANGSSGYRLRAGASSPAAAQQACKAIQAGGESCFIAR
jgi:cell division protein FtsN